MLKSVLKEAVGVYKQHREVIETCDGEFLEMMSDLILHDYKDLSWLPPVLEECLICFTEGISKPDIKGEIDSLTEISRLVEEGLHTYWTFSSKTFDRDHHYFNKEDSEGYLHLSRMQYQIISYGPFIGLNTEGIETPEEIKRKALRGPGRPPKQFIDCINPEYKNQADLLTEKIRAEINGKEPLYIASVIYALRDLGYISYPSQRDIANTFFPDNIDYMGKVYKDYVPKKLKYTRTDIKNGPDIEMIKNRLRLV